jgi:hypothetical protein
MPTAGDSWMFRELIYALMVVLICIVVHTTALVVCGRFLVKRRDLIATKFHVVNQVGVLLAVSVFIILLHLIETCIWALFFWNKDLFPAVEGLAGVLLCGLSTAFIFAVVHAVFQVRYKGEE